MRLGAYSSVVSWFVRAVVRACVASLRAHVRPLGGGGGAEITERNTKHRHIGVQMSGEATGDKTDGRTVTDRGACVPRPAGMVWFAVGSAQVRFLGHVSRWGGGGEVKITRHDTRHK